MSLRALDGRDASADSREASAFPCTLLQQGLWTRHQKQGPHGLNVAMRWLVSGRLSHATAQRALASLVQRYEILRTSFREVEGRLVQLVWPTCAFALHDIDLSTLTDDARAARAEEIARHEARAPMDPERAPLLRATLLRLAPDRAVLLLTLHGMVADGWSTGLLIAEFRAAARAIDGGGSPDAAEPELQFADYALWEKELLASDALDEARAFWRRQLRGVAGTRVPADRPDAIPSGDQSEIASLLLADDAGRSIEGFARRHNVTLYSLAAAALALMLHRLTGEREIVFGSQVANREDPLAEQLVGPTINAITLCLQVDDAATTGAFVGGVADSVAETLRHQRLPFEIAEGFAGPGDGQPLQAVNLVVHRSYSGTAETEQDRAQGFSLLSLPSYSSGTLWDLNFYMIGRDEGWRLSCEADAGLYDPQTVLGLVDAWRRCLEALAVSTGGRLADCPVLREISPRVAAVRQPLPVLPRGDRSPIPVDAPERQVARFHEAGTQTPVILLNNRSVYYQLARQLGEDRPVTDIVLYHQTAPLELGAYAFEDFAAYAVRLIRWAQPRGPYILGGHCVYGVVAFEAARQLQRMGETVELVALFDSWAPGYRETMSPWNKKMRRAALRLHHYADMLRQFRRGEIGFNEIVRKPLLYRLGMLPAEAGPERQVLPGYWFDDFLYEAVARYRPEPYDGDVTIFRSNEALRGRLFDERMGWGPLVSGRLHKRDVRSGHFDMFREQPAGEIAGFLPSLLAEAERR
ncbi:hypothetical protein BH11PSE3_BH11PSE3_20340 [soil metagenome]